MCQCENNVSRLHLTLWQRSRVYSRRFQQTRSLTVQLQHMYRHHCYLRRNATCIQQSVRSWQARRELYRRRTAVWTASILSMQSLALALIAKIVAVEESQRQAEIVQRAKVFAARKTQALFRGKRQRQRFLHHRNQKIGAALLLQRFGRQVLSMCVETIVSEWRVDFGNKLAH